MAKPSISHLLESPAVRLIRMIGSPMMPEGGRLSTNNDESLELYQLAVKNKIPLLYLEALKGEGRLNQLEAKYGEEKVKYLRFTDGVVRVSKTLNAAGIKYVIFKTIKPYPAVPVDIDLLILGDDELYKRSVEVLLRAGYPPQTPNIVDMADLIDDNAYKRAVELLTKPTYERRHISPTGTDLLDPEHGIDIDLQKDIAVSYIIYLDKNKFNDNIIKVRLNGQEVNTLAPEFDLLSVIAHSLMEQLYLLGEYYTFLYQLSGMDEEEVGNFITIVKENRLKAAVRASATITAELHKAAYGVVPKRLEFILDELGVDASEAKNLEQNNFKMPHKYKALTVTNVLLGKLGEPRFRKSVLTQVIKMLNPRLTKQVIGELTEIRRRETYLKEAEGSRGKQK